jgi:hypothetical protein
MPSGEWKMTTIYTNNSNVNIRKLTERFKVPFDDVVKVVIDPTQITIHYLEVYDDLKGKLIISCTKVIYDSQLAHHLSHA